MGKGSAEVVGFFPLEAARLAVRTSAVTAPRGANGRGSPSRLAGDGEVREREKRERERAPCP